MQAVFNKAKILRDHYFVQFSLAAIIFFAAMLRYIEANHSMWFDEYASIFFASQPFARLWSFWMLRETNPPLFYTILRGWMLLCGQMGHAWLRVPTIAASLIAILVVFQGVKQAYGSRAALAAALLLSVSAHNIYYAEQIRAYSFQFLALAVSFWGLLKIVTASKQCEQEPILAWVAYACGAIAAVYLHTTSFLWPAIASLSLMIVDTRFRPLFGRRFAALVAADLFILICTSWWLYVSYIQARSANDNIGWMHSLGIKKSLVTLWSSVLLVRVSTGWSQVVPVILVGIAAIGAWKTRHNVATRLVLSCQIVAIIIFVALDRKVPLLSERTSVWISIFTLYLMASCMGCIKSSRIYFLVLSLSFVIVLVNLINAHDVGTDEPWDKAVTIIAHDPRGIAMIDGEGSAVVMNTACRVELHQHGCPFPIVILAGPGQHTNSWARGEPIKSLPVKGDALALPVNTHVYTIDRFTEAPLSELQAVGLFVAAGPNHGFFDGPFGGGMVDELNNNSHIYGKLFKIIHN